MKHAQQTIVDLEKRLTELAAEEHKIKSAINCLCEVMGEPPKYDEAVEKPSKTAGLRPDEYYGRPQATVVTEVLKKRLEAGLGSASLDEIFEQLVAGGHQFTGKNDGIKKRGLAISMSKNPKFHRLPNDTWGLTKWYSTIKESKESSTQAKSGNGVIAEKTTPEEETPKEEQ